MKKIDLVTSGKKDEHLYALRELGYDHIATRIEALWDTKELNTYFNSTIIDHRGNRSGFPTQVFSHILRLFVLHNVEDETFKLDPWSVQFYR